MTNDSDSDSRDAAESSRLDESVILDLNFVPEWARREPGAVSYAGSGRRDSRGGRGGDAWRSSGRRERSGTRRPSSPRPARGEPRAQRSVRADAREPMRADAREPVRRAEARRPERLELPPLRIRFLPEQKTLSAIVRRIRSTRRAYPLDQLADFVLGAEESCYAKVEPERRDAAVSIFQCKRCRTIALDRDALMAHFSATHRDDFFAAEESVQEAPTGQFPCVAKCGLTGILLGPPNHHSYAEKVQEIHKSRFPNMPIEAYRARIQTLHDEEAVDRWKEEFRTQTVYRLKAAEAEAIEPMAAAEADRYLRETVAPAEIVRVKSASLPLDIARAITIPELQAGFAAAWRQTQRFPRSLVLALRAAFSHMHLHLFKVGKNHEFVMAVKPSPLDPEHTVDNIRETLLFLKEHPGCKRKELVFGLRPDVDPGSPEVASILSPLTWLIEKGHIIEFFDGALSVPLGGGRAAKAKP